MWKDARFCMTCHQHDYASQSWQSSIHGRTTTCHDCHHQPLHQYAEEIYVLLTQKEKFPKSMKHIPYVTRDLCESCHIDRSQDTSNISGPFSGKSLKEIPKINKTRLHALHLSKGTDTPLPRSFHLLKEDAAQFGKFEQKKNSNDPCPKNVLWSVWIAMEEFPTGPTIFRPRMLRVFTVMKKLLSILHNFKKPLAAEIATSPNFSLSNLI